MTTNVFDHVNVINPPKCFSFEYVKHRVKTCGHKTKCPPPYSFRIKGDMASIMTPQVLTRGKTGLTECVCYARITVTPRHNAPLTLPTVTMYHLKRRSLPYIAHGRDLRIL